MRMMHLLLAENPKWTEEGDFWLTLIGGLLAVVAFSIGLSQYVRSQNWEVARTLPSLIAPFASDRRIRAARIMLDWDAREIEPEKGRKFSFNNTLLEKALRIPKRDVDCKFTEKEVMIRDAFDAFFDYFEQLHLFLRKGLIAPADMSYFKYWIGLVRHLDRYKPGTGLHDTIHAYIKTYEFKGFETLMDEFRSAPLPELEGTRESQEAGEKSV